MNKLKTACKVTKGPGNICSEPILMETHSHRSIMIITEIIPVNNFLLVIKIFIRHFSSNYLRVHFIEDLEILFYKVFNIFCLADFQIRMRD